MSECISGLRPDANCHSIHFKDLSGAWIVQICESYEVAQEAMLEMAKAGREVWYFGPVEEVSWTGRRVP